jgi:hypothetical protein
MLILQWRRLAIRFIHLFGEKEQADSVIGLLIFIDD